MNSTSLQGNRKVLVTGASGFVGRYMCEEMLRQGWQVRGAVRSSAQLPDGAEVVAVGNIDGDTGWMNALRGVDAVIHLAARVHVMKDTAVDPLAEFIRVNLYGTSNLAQQAARAGVRRLVYVSSVKVNGERTAPISPLSPNPSPIEGEGKNVFFESDEPNPHDPYAISKWRAEQDLLRIAQESGLEIVIVRPPLVYGPGVKGNFISLMAAIDKGVPLPLAGANNLRSLVYVENLVDALIVCATHPGAAGKIYLVSDGEDISTPDLLRRLGTALGRPARLFHCTPALLKLAGQLTGKSDQVERLLSSLQVDSGKIRRDLNWAPPYSLQQGLQVTAEWYRTKHR